LRGEPSFFKKKYICSPCGKPAMVLQYHINDTLVHVKIILSTYHKNRENVYPLGVDDFERKCFRLLPSGRWCRHPLHRSWQPAMWWMVHVALQTTSPTFNPNSSTFMFKTKHFKWCYCHVDWYTYLLIMSRSTEDQIFLTNNIPKRKEKKRIT
jgi:hypothetical protein